MNVYFGRDRVDGDFTQVTEGEVFWVYESEWFKQVYILGMQG